MSAENISLLFDPSHVSAQTSDSHSWGSWSCLRAWGHGTRLELSDASNGGKNIAPQSLLSCSYHLKCTMKKTNLRHPTAANVEDILQTETAVMIQNQPPFHRKTPQLHSPYLHSTDGENLWHLLSANLHWEKRVRQVTARHSGWTSEDYIALHIILLSKHSSSRAQPDTLADSLAERQDCYLQTGHLENEWPPSATRKLHGSNSIQLTQN